MYSLLPYHSDSPTGGDPVGTWRRWATFAGNQALHAENKLGSHAPWYPREDSFCRPLTVPCDGRGILAPGPNPHRSLRDQPLIPPRGPNRLGVSLDVDLVNSRLRGRCRMHRSACDFSGMLQGQYYLTAAQRMCQIQPTAIVQESSHTLKCSGRKPPSDRAQHTAMKTRRLSELVPSQVWSVTS